MTYGGWRHEVGLGVQSRQASAPAVLINKINKIIINFFIFTLG